MSLQAVVTFDQVGLSYEREKTLFKGIDLVLEAGKFYFLTGSSGSGKSSFLKLIYAGLSPTWGKVTVFNRDSRTLSPAQRALLRQNIGIVFQDFKLMDHLTVIENVALPLRIRGLEGPKSRKQAKELLSWVGVEAFDAYPRSLSGGEKQRVAIARAVIARPKLLLADEPTGNVDEQSAVKLLYLFEELHKIGTTIVVATHNLDLISKLPHPTLYLQNKTLVMMSSTFSSTFETEETDYLEEATYG